MKAIPSLGFALVLTFLISACGGGGSDASSTGKSTASKDSEASNLPISQEVVIEANDQMKFNISEFTVNAGERIRLTLDNVGSMPKMSMGHNVVILEPNTDEEAFVTEAAQHPRNDYLPESSDAILAHTRMLGGGESDSITFVVPKKKGKYPFVCSFPGHFQIGMRGDMIVQ